MFYRYVAVDQSGGRKEGKMEASSVEQVRAELRKGGLEPVAIREDYLSYLLSYWPFSRKTLSDSEILEILSFLNDFLASGMDAAMALDNLETVVGTKRAQATVRTLRTQIGRGSTLSDAIKKTGAFPEIVHAGVYAGEQAGEMLKALDNLEDGVRRDMEFRQEVHKVVTYPSIIAVLVFAVIGTYLVYVVPKLRGIIEITGVTPTPTKILFAVMELAHGYWWTSPPLVAALIFGAKQLRDHLGDEKVELITRSLPLFGRVIIATSMTRIFFTLNLLLKAGMNIKDALTIVASSQASRALRNALLGVSNQITRGKPVSASFRHPLFPDLVSRMLEVGEKAGKLERYTELTAAYYKKKTERELRRLTTYMEPFMVFVAAGFVLLLFFGFIMPVYQSIMSLTQGLIVK